MLTLYDQLLELQRLPHAYTEWAAYREALTGFIVRHTERSASALIVGAGACNDLDLAVLAEHFSTVLLLDHQESAMAEGLKRQGMESGRIQTVKADVLGIPEASYRALCGEMLEKIRLQARLGEACPEVLEHIFVSRMKAAFQRRRPDDFLGRKDAADYVICCGLHSQLLGMFPRMAGVYRKHAAFDLDSIYSAVRAMNNIAARELNTALLELAKVGVVLGLEESRVGMDGGIEGAAQALADIRRRDAVVAREINLLWPLDSSQGKIYDMKVMLIKNGCPGKNSIRNRAAIEEVF